MKVMWFIKTKWWSDLICIYFYASHDHDVIQEWCLFPSQSLLLGSVQCSTAAVGLLKRKNIWSTYSDASKAAVMLSAADICGKPVLNAITCCSLHLSTASASAHGSWGREREELHTNISVFITNKLHWINHHKRNNYSYSERSGRWKLWKVPANVNLMCVHFFFLFFLSLKILKT